MELAAAVNGAGETADLGDALAGSIQEGAAGGGLENEDNNESTCSRCKGNYYQKYKPYYTPAYPQGRYKKSCSYDSYYKPPKYQPSYDYYKPAYQPEYP